VALAAAQCSADGIPSGFNKDLGSMIRNDPRECKAGLFNLFSGTICLVQSTMAQAMFSVYCKMVVAFTPIARIALELYIMVYAVGFLFNIIPNVTLGDATIRVIKVTIIYLLIITPDYFYFWIYEMFMKSMDDFSVMLLGLTPDADGKANIGDA